MNGPHETLPLEMLADLIGYTKWQIRRLRKRLMTKENIRAIGKAEAYLGIAKELYRLKQLDKQCSKN